MTRAYPAETDEEFRHRMVKLAQWWGATEPEDVVQHAMTTAFEKGELSNRSFVNGCVRALCSNARRDDKRRQSKTCPLSVTLDDGNEVPVVVVSDPWSAVDMYIDVWNCLRRMPERQRRAWALSVMGYTRPEIADIMGITKTPVDELLAKAKRKLRQAVA